MANMLWLTGQRMLPSHRRISFLFGLLNIFSYFTSIVIYFQPCHDSHWAGNVSIQIVKALFMVLWDKLAYQQPFYVIRSHLIKFLCLEYSLMLKRLPIMFSLFIFFFFISSTGIILSTMATNSNVQHQSAREQKSYIRLVRGLTIVSSLMVSN